MWAISWCSNCYNGLELWQLKLLIPEYFIDIQSLGIIEWSTEIQCIPLFISTIELIENRSKITIDLSTFSIARYGIQCIKGLMVWWFLFQQTIFFCGTSIHFGIFCRWYRNGAIKQKNGLNTLNNEMPRD